MKKIVLFNGPPGSGKDTLANELVAIGAFTKLEKFAKPIKEHCKNIYGLTDEEWQSVDGTQEAKAEPHPFFFGQTCRQVQINFSELFLKPTHDKYIFGELLARRIQQSPRKMFYISDSGFREEAEVLVEKFGAENVKLIRIHRVDCDYEGDSRSYIELPDDVEQFDVDNNGTVDQAVSKVVNFLNKGE